MIRIHTLAIGLSACFILSGCSDNIEEANQAAPAVVAEAQAPMQQSTQQQPSSEMMNQQAAAGHKHIEGELHVADIFAKKNELKGKVITLHGNVVKVSDGIMGKSWIHIQDGSGGNETNDIVFTSATQTAKVGDHVTAKGTVAVDKDFGSGYFYPVIVEEATFSN